MRIISKEHDYYDSAMSQGQDLTVTFKRERGKFPFPSALSEIVQFPFEECQVNNKNGKFFFCPFAVLFCGKIFKGVCVAHYTIQAFEIVSSITKDFPSSILENIPKPHLFYFYEMEKFEKFSADNAIEWRKSRFDYGQTLRRKTFVDFLGNQGDMRYFDEAVKNKITIMTISLEIPSLPHQMRRAILICEKNALLKNLEFFKVFDAFQAYQEIDMYVSGTLANDIALPIALTEKDRVAQHGFDKWSFRKQSTK